jgi:hypothetical protein
LPRMNYRRKKIANERAVEEAIEEIGGESAFGNLAWPESKQF